MHLRKLGPFECSPIGLGCMNLSHAYGAPPPAAHSERLLHAALDMGYTLFDTAALYGFGENESLLGRALGKKNGISLCWPASAACSGMMPGCGP